MQNTCYTMHPRSTLQRAPLSMEIESCHPQLCVQPPTKEGRAATNATDAKRRLGTPTPAKLGRFDKNRLDAFTMTNVSIPKVKLDDPERKKRECSRSSRRRSSFLYYYSSSKARHLSNTIAISSVQLDLAKKKTWCQLPPWTHRDRGQLTSWDNHLFVRPTVSTCIFPYQKQWNTRSKKESTR